jgi:hypothetical protein
MKRIARLFFAAILLVVALALPAYATSPLSFEGGGYWIDLEIGHTDKPVIAAVRFHQPGDKQGVVLSPRLIVVKAFDTQRKVLVLRYAGGESGVGSFVLSIHQQTAVLETGAKRVVSPFNWAM